MTMHKNASALNELYLQPFFQDAKKPYLSPWTKVAA